MTLYADKDSAVIIKSSLKVSPLANALENAGGIMSSLSPLDCHRSIVIVHCISQMLLVIDLI